MTATNDKLARVMRARVAEIDIERDQLVALLELYTNGAVPTAKSTVENGGFKRRSGGPTDRLLKAVQENPGLPYASVLDNAVEGMETTAEHPRRSLGSTLGSLVKRGKIQRSDDKKYYPVTDIE